MHHFLHTRKPENGGRGIRLLAALSTCILLLCFGGTRPAQGAGGDPLWQYADSLSGKQEATASAVDGGGNVIVAGYQNLTGTNDDYYVVKFKANGSGVAWRATYDKAGGSDQVTAVVVDGNNDVVVTGLAWNGTDNDIHTVKYDGNTGAVLWQHSFNGEANHSDAGTSIAVDSLNNIYVAGYSQNEAGNDDYVIVKYSPSGPDENGAPLWVTLHGGESNGIDRINSIAVKGDAVAVTGRSWNGAAFDMLTILYDRSGTKLWEKRYSSGAGRYCSGSYVKIDSGGNVVATGSVANSIDLDIYTVKYSASTGDVAWEQTYNGAFDEEPQALFIDSSDQVYVAGYSWTLTTFNDIYTVKYNGATGAQEWQQLYNSDNGNTDVAAATGLVVDPSGDVFVTGYSNGNGYFDFHTIKYKKDSGNQLWASSNPNGPALKPVRPVGIGLSPSGEVLVARWADTATHDLDYYVIKYDPGLLNRPTGLSGQAPSNTSIQLSWIDNSDNESGFAIERCQGVGCTTFTQIATVGADVTAYLDSGLTANTYYSYRIRASGAAGYSHYSDSATVLSLMVNFISPAWNFVYNSAANKDDFANAIAVGPDNNPVVTGKSDSFPPGYSSGLTSFDYYTVKIDRATGGQIWADRYNDPTDAVDIGTCLAVDNSNAVSVSGYATLYNGHSGDVNSVYTIRYPASGPPPLWAKQYNGPSGTGATDDRAFAIASSNDASGNAVVVGHGINGAGNSDIYLIKYTGDGTQLWAATPFNGAGGDDFPNAVAIAADGSVFVTGYTEKEPNTNKYNFYTAKHNGLTGAVIWTDVYSVTSTGDNRGKNLVIDAAGDLYVTGSAMNAAGNKDFYTIKYNGTSATAQRVWERAFDGAAHGDDEAVAIKIDPVDGNLVVGGTSLSGAGNGDFTILRYTPAGDLALAKTYQRPAYDDHATAMGVDSNGNIYLTGYTIVGTSTDALTVKFDYLGNIGSAVQYGTAGNNDETSAIVVNSVDEAFVAGSAENASGNADYLIYKIDADTSQPFMPYGLTATSTYVTATVGWSDKSVVKDGYRIERKAGACGTSNTNPWGATVTLPVSPRSYTDTGLNSGSSYCYRVQTFTNNGAATRWAEKTVSTPVLPAPSTLTVTSFNSTQVNLAWGDTTTAETGFRLERCTGANCTDFAPLATPGANATSYSDTTPCNSTVYRYRILASGPGWDSPFSNIATVTTTIPGTPVLTVTRNSEVQMNLSWTDNNADESGFTVERCTGADCSNFTAIATKAANSTNHNDTGLTPNTSYTYRVTAFKTAACPWTRPSTPANNVVTTILEPLSPTATANNTTQITVGWGDRTASETGFRIERCTGTGCSDFSQIGTAAANAVTYPDANVTQGVTYRYRVRATNSTLLWDSPYSTVVERMAPAAATPVLTATRYSEAQINLTWTDANTDESGFRVERCTGSGCSNFVQIGTDLVANTFSYNDTTGLLPNTTYTYRVSAFKNATNSWTMPSVVKEATTTLLEPTTLAATANSTTQITLTWVDRTGSETGFKIERCEGTGCTAFAQIGTVAAGIVTYADTSVSQGITYRYQVRATNSSIPWDSLYSTPVERMAPAATTPVLTAARYSEAQINLSWTDTNSDEGGFKVERCTGSGCSNFSQIGTNLAANTYSYNDTTGLLPNTTYTYRVSAFKTATNSWTMPSVAKEATTTLLEPNNFSCAPTGGSTTQITCSWTDRTASETGFKIERCLGATCSDFTLQLTAAANATTYNDTTVCTGLVYNYRISATRNSAPLWDSTYSIAAPATASSAAKPVLTVTNPSETQNNLTWTDATPDETGYKVERCTGSGCSNFVQIGSNLPANTFSYNDTGLTPGTSYTYRIKGYKTASCPWETISDPITIAPVIPGNTLTVATVSTTQINLSWTDTTTSETGFRVERCEGVGCSNFVEIGTAPANSTGYNDTSVCSGNSYTYRVRATNSTLLWDSAYSNTAAGITPAFTNMLVDSGFENSTSGWPTAVGTLTGTSFDATTIYNGAKSLKLAATGAQLGRSQSVTVIPGRQYVLSGTINAALTAGKVQCDVSGTGIDSTGIVIAYNDAVRNNAGWQNLSETVTIPAGTISVAVRCFADGAPQGTAYIDGVSLAPADFILTATRISDVQVNLSWPDSVSDETGYKIERCAGTGCTDFAEISTAAANATSFANTGLTGNTTYRYQVRGYKTVASGCSWNSAYSTTAEAVTTATPPSGLTATTVNTTQINLGWTDTTLSENGFKIERCAGVGCSDFVELPTPAAANATSYQDTTAAAGTTYRYRVRAANTTAGWNSAYSNEASAATPATATPVLTATRASEAQINLTWTDANTDETGFNVERCTGSGCSNFVQIGSNLAPNTFSYNDTTGLTPDTTYTYRVSAFKTATPNGWTVPSIAKEATTTLDGPNGFSCTPVSTTQINCSWTDRTASETGFKIERCTGTGCIDFAQKGTVAANITTYADDTVAQGITYRYRVRATNGTLLWDSAYSTIVEQMAPAAVPPVLSATAVSDVRINLSWTDPTTDETGYKLERCSGVDCTNFVQIGGNLAPNTTTYSDLALTPSTTYVYRVSGYKTATSPWTMTSNAATASTNVLGPINLNVTAVDTTTTRLAWTNQSTTETGISIERCMGAGCSDFAAIATIGAGLATYNDTTPCNNQPYSYRVRAINTVVPWTTAYSNTVSITIPTPVSPTLLTAARVNETQINLSWTDNTTDETGYKIERCEGAGCTNFTQLTTVLANVRTYNNTGLAPSTTYRYQVRAYKTPSLGCAWDSGYSNISEAATTIAAPTALTATTANSTQMNLAWTNNTVSETGYKIERCTGAGCADFAQIAAPIGKATSWTDSTVAAGTTYRYQIRATNTTIPWDSGYSNSATGNTYPQDAPVLSATATSIKVTLNWVDKTVDETGFKIEKCTGAACADYAQIALVAANATTYTDTAVCNGTTYNYRVRATKSTDRTYDTPYSNIVPATTSAGTIALTAARASEVQINLTWTDPTTEEDGYRVERCVGSGCSDFTQMAALAKNSVSWTDATGLLPGYTYTYRVKNYNSTATCPWETSSNITSAVTSISVPTGLTATAAGMTQINLSWSDSTVTKTGFKIERCTGAACSNFVQVALLTGSATTWSDTSVIASTTYRYRVRATKTTSYAWDSEYSAIASATTASLAIPAAPSALSAARISNSQINLTWNDVVTDGAGYRIERCSGIGCSSFSEIATVGPGVKTYANNGLTGSTTYGYRVRGYKTSSPAWTTAYSNTSYASTAIDSPTALTATAITASEIKLTWMDNSGAVNGYNIEEQIWNGEWVTISSVGAHVTSYTDDVGKEPLKPYTYRIKAFNGVESSSYSNVATVTTPAFVTTDPVCALPNPGPVISSTAGTTASEGTVYTYQVLATAQGGRDPLTYSLVRKPEGMTVSTVGLVTWTPGYSQGGDQNVTVRVTDAAGFSSDQSFAITVGNVNRPPVFTSAAVTTALSDHPYSYQAAASDPEGDTLTFTLVAPSPAGMTISSGGLISWLPTAGQVGDNNVTVRVSDGNFTADQPFTVTVTANHPPYFTSTPVITATEGSSNYSYQVTGSDPDGDALTYALITAPTGMTMTSGNLITWTPTVTQAQAGSNAVTIRVSDGFLTANQDFTITVQPNSAPVIPTTPVTIATENSLYTYAVAATDPNGDPITYTLTGAPTGMTISAAGIITWTPDYNQAGLPSPTVTVRAADTMGLYAEKSFTITVANVNRPPVITSTAVTTGTVGVPYSYLVTGTDPDGTAVSGFTLTTAPAGMSISGAGLIAWTPTVDQATNAVTVRVSDGDLTATQPFNIDVHGPPAVPTLIGQGNFTSNCGGATVILSWNPVAGPRGHAVEYAVQVSGGAWSAWQSGTTFALTVSPMTSYTWLVKARDGVTLLESTVSSSNSFGDNTTNCCFDCSCTPEGCGPSSCPLVYSWDGTKYNYETDLQGPAISQIKKGSRNVALYQPSYIVLENGLATDANHQYRVKIWESLQEASLVDEATLLAVDYPEGYQIVSSGAENTYYYNYFDPFRIYTIKNPILPVAATDKNGNDVLAAALNVDNRPVPMVPDDPDNFYTLDFGTIQHPEYAKLVIDGWQDINSKIYLSTITIQPYIEVVNQAGAWVKVKSFGMPAGDLKTMVVDLANLFPTSDHRIRLHLGIKKAQVWVFDRIRLDDSAPVSVSIQQLQATAADLQVAGHAIQSMTSITSRIIATDEVQPLKPTYYGYGNFTRLGDVKPLVTQRDDKYVVMNYADKLELAFPEPLPPQSGMKRGFVLKVDNYYKEFKEYKYVEPLPFHGMSDYPYPVTESYPTDADHTQYQLEYNTRVVAP